MHGPASMILVLLHCREYAEYMNVSTFASVFHVGCVRQSMPSSACNMPPHQILTTIRLGRIFSPLTPCNGLPRHILPRQPPAVN